MKRALHIGKGFAWWAMAVPVTIGTVMGCGAAHALTRLLGLPLDGRLVHPVTAAWGRTIFRLTPGWTIQVEGQEHLPQDGTPVVLVANHESMTDIFVLYFLPLQFRWLSKQEVFDIPLIGHAMTWARYVPVRRGERDSATSAMIESQQRINSGISMLYFPEGTRSDDGSIKTFKLGAFRLARDTGVPVIPVVLKGTRDLMPKHGRVPQKADVRIKVLAPVAPPVPADGDGTIGAPDDLEAYAARIRDLIAATHDSL